MSNPDHAVGPAQPAVEIAVVDGIHVVHGGDLGCARLLILLRKHVLTLPAGTEVHLETTDPVAPIDLPAWCRMTGHTYLGPVSDAASTERAVPRYAVRVAGDARPTQPGSPWRLADQA